MLKDPLDLDVLPRVYAKKHGQAKLVSPHPLPKFSRAIRRTNITIL